MLADDEKSWIFVSHASEDIDAVRRVRNHLEALGAAPLLFHLRALTRAKEFWPLIEKEIEARSFFLYCESAAAERSEWVRRERAAVEKAAKRQAKRIGHVRVDGDQLDTAALDDFAARTRVYLADNALWSVDDDFRSALRACGFKTDVGRAPDREMWQEMNDWHFEDAAKSGWVLVFLTQENVTPHGMAASNKTWGEQIIRQALRHGPDRVVPVITGELTPPESLSELLSKLRVFDARRDRRNAPARLVRELLTR